MSKLQPLIDKLQKLATKRGQPTDAAAAYFHASLLCREFEDEAREPVTRNPWTAEEDATLRTLKISDLEAFASMTGRTLGGVRTRWHRLNNGQEGTDG